MNLKQTYVFYTRDETGCPFTVIEYTEMVNAGSINNPNETVEGLKRYFLESGERVNRLDEKTFQIVLDGKTLKTD